PYHLVSEHDLASPNMTKTNTERDEQLNHHGTALDKYRENIAKLQTDVTNISKKLDAIMELLSQLAKGRAGSTFNPSGSRVEDPTELHQPENRKKQIMGQAAMFQEEPPRRL
ncbi:unnamed protein product, partial [Ilex paraguariensis]